MLESLWPMAKQKRDQEAIANVTTYKTMRAMSNVHMAARATTPTTQTYLTYLNIFRLI